MMKSIYGKLICGFLITILFSFSVSVYIAIRSNYDQIDNMTQTELAATSDFVSSVVNNVSSENINEILSKYSNSSEVNVTLYSPEFGYLTYGKSTVFLPDKETMQNYYYDNSKDGVYGEQNNYQTYGSLIETDTSDIYVYIQKDTSYEKRIFANSAILILGCVFLSGRGCQTGSSG